MRFGPRPEKALSVPDRAPGEFCEFDELFSVDQEKISHPARVFLPTTDETDEALSCEDRNSLFERKISSHRLSAKQQIILLDHSGGSTQS